MADETERKEHEDRNTAHYDIEDKGRWVVFEGLEHCADEILVCSERDAY